ncbi:DUF3450 domain-containing protein [Halioglobus japonicus]|uniref:DUF3450 domain-containing protein n=1 Tax=Halioglobus japonicus TaxID=930805 RepID=A0AAP8MH90_9GAMM|nr:DUF3450 domain-containing protein [Halioglobus japonicus]PLW87820.1 DUF3450 domain-containing protein [Halioglobus japonicus]GHD06390.1 DUF3450 domain-containing protein [Halioglobus japonicus]
MNWYARAILDKELMVKKTLIPTVLIAALASVAPLVQGQDIDTPLEVVAETNRGAEASQRKIDELSRQTRMLLEEYRSLRESSEYQDAYTRELEQLDAAQQARIESLNQQIAQARITRQRILPLMRSMADALEKFVVLDLPFHQEQRVTGVLQLKERLDNPQLSVAVRFRLLLEAYQIEQGYGNTVEAWRGALQRDGERRSVEYLRIGRAALYYQSLDRAHSAYWDHDSQSWVDLDSTANRSIARAMRVARNQAAPELLELPLLPSGGAL